MICLVRETNRKRKKTGAQPNQSENLRDWILPIRFEDSVEVRSLSSGWQIYFFELSAFTMISDSKFLLLRPIRACVPSGPLGG